MNIKAPLKTQIPALRSLWKEAFGDTDAFLDIFFKTAFSLDRCRCITEDDQVLAALYWFNCKYNNHSVAYIYAVATAQSHRGQGLCRHLMADTHRHLAELGYESAILVPGSLELFHFYKKIGYQSCTGIRKFECEANTEELLLLPVTKEEYASLRKIHLPPNSILQEKENLDFLDMQADFYIGQGILFTVYKSKHSLSVIELLGDISSAPAIVHTLGYKKGMFRTPGQSTPFTMYYPLQDHSVLPPSYFAFAFD